MGFRSWIGKTRQLSRRSNLSIIAATVITGVSLAAGIATLSPLVGDFLWPNDIRIYVLHSASIDAKSNVLNEFDEGVSEYLVDEWDGRLNGAPIGIRDGYKLIFQSATWPEGDEEELVRRVDFLLNAHQPLAVVAATNSQESEILLERLLQEEEPPALLLATATKNDLLLRLNQNGEPEPLPGVFRMVPQNRIQASRLAKTILSPPSPTEANCKTRTSQPISVAILREEKNNAAFSRDLAHALRLELEKPQEVEILVDAVVDSLLTIPRELVELQPHFLVYIGSQIGAAQTYRQIQRLRDRIVGDVCLPRLLLTDASLSSDQPDYYKGLVERSAAALPFSGEEEEKASFARLGYDSAHLLLKAIVETLESDSQSRLSRASLLKALGEVKIEGKAHYYSFKNGENNRADFHLWSVSAGLWKHSKQCNSDYHNRNEIERIESHHFREESRNRRRTDSALEIRVGSKTFPEQLLLANIAVAILQESGIQARLGQMSLNGMRDLLLLNRVDGYWEYTGTALHRHHGVSGLRGPAALEMLRKIDAQRVVWLDPLPVNNTYRLLARKAFSTEHDIDSISDIAQYLSGGGRGSLCVNSEWVDLEDGLRGLQEEYGFVWPQELRRTEPLALLYALAEEECDVLLGFATDSRLPNSQRVALKDDRNFFPEYLPAFVLRQDVHERLIAQLPNEWELARERFACLREHVNIERMRQSNGQIEEGDKAPEEVAKNFLAEQCPLLP